MEMFVFTSAVRGYRVYQDLWKPSIREKLVAKREFNNPMDKRAVKVVKGNSQPFVSQVLPNNVVFSSNAGEPLA